LREQLYELRTRLLTATRQAEPDLAHIDQLIDEIGGLQSQLQKKVVRNMLKDGEVLTPRQRDQYFGMFEDHVRSWRQGRGQQRRGGRGPRWQRDY
jgi:Spy/CpxP family protein refolding chaperone